MAKAFPTDHPFLRGYYAPVHTEADAPHLPITGEVPAGLRGTLYRNGPNPQFAPRGPYHWFAGDGMIHAFRIANGRVSYRNRWVHTPKWALENAEGEALSGSFGHPAFSDPRIVALNSTVANTNIVWFSGRLLALEEAHAPFAIDPVSLEARGYETFGDGLVGPFTAHPKFDPQTGEMVFFGYSAKGRFSPWASVQVSDRDGKVTRADLLELPFASMIHDFAVTRNWIILPVFPLTGSMSRAMAGKPPYAWEPELGTRIALIPRHGDISQTRWIDAPACYVFHPMNHFETDDGRIVVDVMKYDVAPLFPRPDGSPTGPGDPMARPPARVRRRRSCGAGRSTRRGSVRVWKNASSTTAPASSRASTNASRCASTATAGSSAATWRRCGAAPRPSTASCTTTCAPGAARPGCPTPATTAVSRSSCRDRPMRPRAMAGCCAPSTAARRTAATSRCSRPPTSPGARSRWRT